MVILLMLPFLFGNFVQKFYLDKGTEYYGGRVLVCDSDRDSQIELIFGYYENYQEKIVVYELYPDSIFHLEVIIDTMTNEAWDVGDFDNDGLFDLVVGGDFGLPVVGPQIYESPDSFSYPTREVWRDTVGSALVTPICAYDIDQDGLPEIVKVLGDYIHLHIYESIGNNLYDKIAEITTAATHNSSSTLAFGDFDLDNKNEFVWGYTGGEYSIWECIGNNSYQEVTLQQLTIPDIKDCFTVPDADGDGKMEFVLKGEIDIPPEVYPFILEATADNTYQIIKSFILAGGDDLYAGGYSDAGDVDGDSIPEIVLEACQNIYIIKSEGNDSFYVWDTLPGQPHGCNVRIADDIDGNGLNEIVISGNNETRVYEYEVEGIEEIRGEIQVAKLEIFPNPFRDKLYIKYQGSVKNRIELKIYDTSGRLVKQFNYSINHQSQSLQIIWDGKDNGGKQLPSGVYFAVLKQGAEMVSKKFLLIR